MLMHMKGSRGDMQDNPAYGDVIVEIKDLLKERMDLAIRSGMAEEQIADDPGIGFGKTVDHNLQRPAWSTCACCSGQLELAFRAKGSSGQCQAGCPWTNARRQPLPRAPLQC